MTWATNIIIKLKITFTQIFWVSCMLIVALLLVLFTFYSLTDPMIFTLIKFPKGSTIVIFFFLLSFINCIFPVCAHYTSLLFFFVTNNLIFFTYRFDSNPWKYGYIITTFLDFKACSIVYGFFSCLMHTQFYFNFHEATHLLIFVLLI